MGDGAYGSAYKVLRGKALPGGGFILSKDDETGTPADGASAENRSQKAKTTFWLFLLADAEELPLKEWIGAFGFSLRSWD